MKIVCYMDICLFLCLMDKKEPCFKMFPKGRNAVSIFLFCFSVPNDFVSVISALIGLFSAAIEQNYRNLCHSVSFFSVTI